MENIGNKIRMLRVINGYPQEYIAFQLGISQSAYSRQESGQTQLSLTHIKALSKIYAVSMIDIIEKNTNDLIFQLVGSQLTNTNQ